uniref:dihydrofolate reductase n=1 Tax=Pseudomonas phage RVTF4 TaxID=3236931 RepID=A0AB39CCT7_9VIRU
MKLILVAAFAGEGIIGLDGGMPWHCTTDLQHFRRLTTGDRYACLMGRKTWESLPDKKLPGRTCIVLTSGEIEDDRCITADTFERAKRYAQKHGITKLFIIGGATLFNEYYNHCDEMYLTHIHEEVREGDTFFRPDIKPVKWRLLNQWTHSDCTINRWVKR